MQMISKAKRLLSVLVFIIVFFATACGEKVVDMQDTVVTQNTSSNTENTGQKVSPESGSWAVYWYLCGSDLESGGGFATGDLSELMEVKLPENVKVVIETGGASAWQNDLVDAEKLQRWVYNSEGLTLVDEQPSANMGETQTLAEFLRFAKDNYPAEKQQLYFGIMEGDLYLGQLLMSCTVAIL